WSTHGPRSRPDPAGRDSTVSLGAYSLNPCERDSRTAAQPPETESPTRPKNNVHDRLNRASITILLRSHSRNRALECWARRRLLASWSGGAAQLQNQSIQRNRFLNVPPQQVRQLIHSLDGRANPGK